MSVSFGSCKKEPLPDPILRENKIFLRKYTNPPRVDFQVIWSTNN